MSEEIVKYINNNSGATISEIVNYLRDKNPEDKSINQKEISFLLKDLEYDFILGCFASKYYVLETLKNDEGYINWTANGFCWIEKEKRTNDFGLSQPIGDNLTIIANKKNAILNGYGYGKVLDLEDRKVFFLKEFDINKHKVIAWKNEKNWNILNNGQNISFAQEIGEKDDIAIFEFDNEFKYIESLGKLTDFGIETKITKTLFNIEKNTVEIKNIELPKLETSTIPFYTIDAASTKDIDDAICVEKDQCGYNLWIAIADVSSIVLNNTIEDQKASEVCTSFYFPHEVIHMLDRDVAENYASLNCGQTRGAMICKIRVDLNGKIEKYEFENKKIKSVARLTYDDVLNVLNNKEFQESVFFDGASVVSAEQAKSINKDLIKQNLMWLKEILDLPLENSPDSIYPYKNIDFKIGEDGKIKELYEEDRDHFGYKMVEKAMLYANKCAAQFLHENYPHIGLFRNQEKVAQNERMKPAFYDFSNDGHWGLKADYYTHFTSPIRRYCDLIVHRIIKSKLNNAEMNLSQEKLKEIADRINIQQTKSKQSALKVKNLLIGQYIENLVKNDKTTYKLKAIDYSENGLLCRSKEKIDFFIPDFKLDRGIRDNLVAWTQQEKEFGQNKEIKENNLKTINEEYVLKAFLESFSWLDERKNPVYYIKTKKSLLDKDIERKNKNGI